VVDDANPTRLDCHNHSGHNQHVRDVPALREEWPKQRELPVAHRSVQRAFTPAPFVVASYSHETAAAAVKVGDRFGASLERS